MFCRQQGNRQRKTWLVSIQRSVICISKTETKGMIQVSILYWFTLSFWQGFTSLVLICQVELHTWVSFYQKSHPMRNPWPICRSQQQENTGLAFHPSSSNLRGMSLSLDRKYISLLAFWCFLLFLSNRKHIWQGYRWSLCRALPFRALTFLSRDFALVSVYPFLLSPPPQQGQRGRQTWWCSGLIDCLFSFVLILITIGWLFWQDYRWQWPASIRRVAIRPYIPWRVHAIPLSMRAWKPSMRTSSFSISSPSKAMMKPT